MKIPTLVAASNACACRPGRRERSAKMCRDWIKRAALGSKQKRAARLHDPVGREPASAPEIEHLAEQLAREEAPDNE